MAEPDYRETGLFSCHPRSLARNLFRAFDQVGISGIGYGTGFSSAEKGRCPTPGLGHASEWLGQERRERIEIATTETV
jgi:hypothetical protein